MASFSCLARWVLAASLMLVSTAPSTATVAAEGLTAGKSLTVTYRKPDGETFFATMLQVTVDRADEGPRQVVLLFDTSASQTGFAREKSLAVLEELLANLRGADLVRLYAVDVSPVELTEGFTAPDSPDIAAALKKLKARTPLGATDLPAALRTAAAAFDAQSRDPKTVVYLGDGMSTANLLLPPSLKKLAAELVDARVPVTSYAVGARTDVHLLAAIANHTGGVVAVENQAQEARRYGQYLANAVRAEVFWPLRWKLPPQMVETLPDPLPPLRTDRDSVIIGRGQLPQESELNITVGGGRGTTALKWTLLPENSLDQHSYLVELVGQGRKHSGITLPLAGSGGLVEARLALNRDLAQLVVLAKQALAMQALDQAESLARRALTLDDTNIDANNLMEATKVKWLEVAKAAQAEQKFRQAAQACLKALQIDPDYQAAKDLLKALPTKPEEAAVAPEPKK